jgi:hypothetical protein
MPMSGARGTFGLLFAGAITVCRIRTAAVTGARLDLQCGVICSLPPVAEHHR